MSIQSNNNYVIPNLDRALSVLEELASAPHGLGVSEVAQRVGIPKNSAFRILYTLHRRGYIEPVEESKVYRLSCRILSLGHVAIDDSTLIERAIPIMYQLRDKVGETILLGVPYQNHGVVLEQIPGTNVVRCTLQIGHEFPFYTSAPGKIFLAWSSESFQEAYFSSIKFEYFTPTTITSVSRLKKELEQVRKKGYAIDLGEQLPELRCIAVPVFDRRGTVVASVWVNAPAFRVSDEQLTAMAESVVLAGHDISAQLGGRC